MRRIVNSNSSHSARGDPLPTPTSLTNSSLSSNSNRTTTDGGGISPPLGVDQPSSQRRKSGSGGGGKKKGFTFFWTFGYHTRSTNNGGSGGKKSSCEGPKGLPLLLDDECFGLVGVDEAQLLHAQELYLRTPDSSRSVSFDDAASWPYIDDDEVVSESGFDSGMGSDNEG